MGSFQKIQKPTRARALDTSSGEQIVGNQLLEDPSFAVAVLAGDSGDHWSCDVAGNDGLSITGGKAVWANDAEDDERRLQDQTDGPFISDITARYRVTIVISDYTDGALKFVTGSYTSGYTISGVGTHIIDMSPETGGGNFHIDGNAAAHLSVSEVSCYKLESFGNNNHAQIYSGRALEFDGVADYLATGYGSGLNPYTTPVTVSFWGNVNANSLCFGTTVGTNQRFYGGVKLGNWDLGLQSAGWNGSVATGALPLGNNDTWYRVVYVLSAGVATVYVNGVSCFTKNYTSFIFNDNFIIGSNSTDLSSTTEELDGMLSDFQIWNAEWTADDVSYDYLNPEQLALNRGGTSLTNSNLKLWYPMNGGHRGNQSYVLDASNTGLGEELITEGDFSSSYTPLFGGSTNWTNSADGNTSWVISNGVATRDGSTTNSGIDQADIIENGKQYNITFTISGRTAGSIIFYRGQGTQNLGSSSSNGTSTIVITSTGTGKFLINGISNFDGSIDNVSVKEVLNTQKNNATTVFYGDEQITATVNKDFSGGGQWSNYGSSSTAPDIEGAKLVCVTDGDGGNEGAQLALDRADGTGGAHPIVAGRTYRMSAKLDNTAGKTTPDINFSIGDKHVNIIRTSDNDTTGTIDTTEQEYYGDITTDDNSTAVLIYQTSADNDGSGTTFTIDDVSIKEIGTATGWTDADQQLDIPQTALQSFNQLAWFDGVADYTTIADHDDFSFTDESDDDEAFSVSAWINMNDATNFPIICKDTGSHREWAFVTGSSDKLTFWVYDNSASAYQGKTYNTGITSYEGKWVHVAATYTGDESNADAGINIYLNGEVIDDTPFNSGSYVGMENKDSVVAIGARLQGNIYANGAITEASIWSKKLGPTEITELYNDGKALDATTHSASPPTGTDHLVGYWRNNGLATWQDLTTNDRDGTPTSITETMLITAGVDGSRDSQGFLMNRQRATNSLNFPTVLGGNDNKEYAVIPTGSGTAPGDNLHFIERPFSFTCWVKTHYVTGAAQIIFDRGDGTDGYLLKVSATGIPVFTTEEDNTEISATAAGGNGGLTSGVMTNGTWYFIAGTHEGIASSADQKLYVGTASVTPALITTQASGIGMETSAANLYIGRRFNGGLPYNGEIDDLSFYDNNELTLAEVTRNYNAGKRSHR